MATTASKAPEPPGVLPGGHLTRVRYSDPTSPSGTNFRWYQIYEFPPGSGQFMAFQYNDVGQADAAHGERVFYRTWEEKDFNRVVLATGDAEEIIGRSGTWTSLVNTAMQEAAVKAGARDPSLVGQMLNDPEMKVIMAQAAIGDWTQQEVIAAQRKTNFWKNTLYPGIEKFYGQTTEPEKAWQRYVATVEPALTALGYQKDANGTYKNQIKKMLNKGIDAEVFVSQVPTFVAAKQNAEFAQVLNQWAKRDLGRDVKFNDWFDLLAGESMPELEAVAERARLAYQNQQASAGLTDEQVASLADRTQLSEAETRALFSEFNQALLALGEPGLQRGGISRDDLLSAFAGVKPASGRSIEEVRLAAAKLARENDLFDEAKISFYVGFDKQGRPNRPGLASLTPEAG